MDLARENRQLKAALRQREAQCRRLVEEIDWAEEQVRVYRRLVERLSREDDHAEDPAP